MYEKKGDLENALVHHQKGLEIKLKLLGSDHPDVATSLMNVGNVLEAMGKYEEALVQHQKSLDIKIRVFGGDHPSVADSKYNLALLHKKRKETDIAR